ncbi:hypothetical protein [Kurthia sibirica]|uniref:Uncharacterized protein n=1 Tax=Kurthia sibirica TaxID=202750 RepID=A0A2U3AIF6_9BACL|nr:hypothetical protein [Kurthia sibirica]PWI24315.1 hypothetical protein DEX24_13915 [Kurthia sibirica]GEK34399.1 hypothetical protein KSI01_19320 [Kurthia sibirica]
MRKAQIKKKNRRSAFMIPLVLVFAILVVATTVLFKIQSPAKELTKQPKEQQSAMIAEAGLQTMAAQITTYADVVYKELLARYNQLTPTDKANFDVQKMAEAQVIERLQKLKNKSIVIDDYDKVTTQQPTSTTMVLSTEQANRFTLLAIGKVGSEKTTLKQSFNVNFNIASTTIASKYEVLYAIHTANKTIVQNASNILGLLAAANTSRIYIDGSSCQHAFTGSTYLNKCVNDGNTNASDLKIQNTQNFDQSLPNFPKKEIKTLDETNYNNEQLFYKKKRPKKDPNDEKEKKKYEKIFFLQDGVMTIDSTTEKKFTQEKPFSFTSSEERLQSLNIDQINAYINIGDGVQTLRIDNVTLSNDAKLHIIGNGQLKLFIKNIRSSDGQIIARDSKVSTYIDGTEPILFSPTFKSAGFLYNNRADLTMNLHNYDGNILSGGKKVAITGGSSPIKQLLLAPKATVELTNRTNFIGAIISRSAVITQSSVTFAQPKTAVNFPLSYKEYGLVRSMIQFDTIEK